VGLLFWQRPMGQELAGRVKKRLIAEYALDPAAVDKMRFSGKKGRYSNRQVQYIRIYDPALIQGGPASAPGYDALAEKAGGSGPLLFEGRIERIDDDVQVFLTDMRTARKDAPAPAAG
jgi:hypothetical protein